jgi:hypothetical protein
MYDAQNTGYYIDPASFTELYGGLRMSGGHGDSTMRLRLLASNNGAGQGVVHLQSWCSEPGNTWSWAGFGYNVDITMVQVLTTLVDQTHHLDRHI